MSVHHLRPPAADEFRVRPGFRLADHDPSATPGLTDGHGESAGHVGKELGAELLTRSGEKLAELQELLYANAHAEATKASAPAVLLVLQGMDAAGKGGIVSHVMGMVDPKGVDYHSFGVPTAEEREHDYLWRIRRALPARGRIGVFDRSHYEDIIAVGVNHLVPDEEWQARYDEVVAFEAELAAAGTHVVKVALTVSPDEQRSRFADRLAGPPTYWKYNPHDLVDRARWPEFRQAYQAVFDRTSTDDAPWYVVPGDHKWFARLAVTQILVERMAALDLRWPTPDFDVDAERAKVAEL